MSWHTTCENHLVTSVSPLVNLVTLYLHSGASISPWTGFFQNWLVSVTDMMWPTLHSKLQRGLVELLSLHVLQHMYPGDCKSQQDLQALEEPCFSFLYVVASAWTCYSCLYLFVPYPLLMCTYYCSGMLPISCSLSFTYAYILLFSSLIPESY